MHYTMEDINLITEAVFYKERSGCLTSLTRVLKGMFFIKDSNLGNEIQATRDYTDRLFLASQTSVNINPEITQGWPRNFNCKVFMVDWRMAIGGAEGITFKSIGDLEKYM